MGPRGWRRGRSGAGRVRRLEAGPGGAGAGPQAGGGGGVGRGASRTGGSAGGAGLGWAALGGGGWGGQGPGRPPQQPLGLMKYFLDYKALYVYRFCSRLPGNLELQSIFHFNKNFRLCKGVPKSMQRFGVTKLSNFKAFQGLQSTIFDALFSISTV